MEIRQKNMIRNVLVIAFLAGGVLACQKDTSGSEDLETWIVKNYFLPDDKILTIHSSFNLCDAQNHKAIDNLKFIYGSNSNNLKDRAENLITEKIDGNRVNDPRQGYILEASEKWYPEIKSGKLDKSKLAYEYAFFQHQLYLLYTDSIKDRKIRDFYKMAKSDTIDGCLKAQMSEKAKTDQRPKKKKEELKKERAKSKGGTSKKEELIKKNSNAKWFLYVFILTLILIEWSRSFIDILQARKHIIGLFKNADQAQKNAQTVVTSTNSNIPEKIMGNKNTNPTWDQTSRDQAKSSSSKESPKTNYEKLQQQSKEPLSSNTTTPHQIVPREKLKEAKPETPITSPYTEPKKEVIREKQTQIPLSPEPKKPEPTLREPTYGSSTLFARIPSGNLFFGFSSQPEYPDTPFVIDEITGTFDLVKDPQTLERLFSMIDQLKDACELMNINQPSLNTYQVRAKGEAVKEGDYWRIEKKLKLDW